MPDHLDEFGNQIKPSDCMCGTRLLHNDNFDTNFDNNSNIYKNEVEDEFGNYIYHF